MSSLLDQLDIVSIDDPDDVEDGVIVPTSMDGTRLTLGEGFSPSNFNQVKEAAFKDKASRRVEATPTMETRFELFLARTQEAADAFGSMAGQGELRFLKIMNIASTGSSNLKSKTATENLTLIIRVTKDFGRWELQSTDLSDDATALLQNRVAFEARYGSHYVQAEERHIVAYAKIEIRGVSEKLKTEFASTGDMSGNLFDIVKLGGGHRISGDYGRFFIRQKVSITYNLVADPSPDTSIPRIELPDEPGQKRQANANESTLEAVIANLEQCLKDTGSERAVAYRSYISSFKLLGLVPEGEPSWDDSLEDNVLLTEMALKAAERDFSIASEIAKGESSSDPRWILLKDYLDTVKQALPRARDELLVLRAFATKLRQGEASSAAMPQYSRILPDVFYSEPMAYGKVKGLRAPLTSQLLEQQPKVRRNLIASWQGSKAELKPRIGLSISGLGIEKQGQSLVFESFSGGSPVEVVPAQANPLPWWRSNSGQSWEGLAYEYMRGKGSGRGVFSLRVADQAQRTFDIPLMTVDWKTTNEKLRLSFDVEFSARDGPPLP